MALQDVAGNREHTSPQVALGAGPPGLCARAFQGALTPRTPQALAGLSWRSKSWLAMASKRVSLDTVRSENPRACMRPA